MRLKVSHYVSFLLTIFFIPIEELKITAIAIKLNDFADANLSTNEANLHFKNLLKAAICKSIVIGKIISVF